MENRAARVSLTMPSPVARRRAQALPPERDCWQRAHDPGSLERIDTAVDRTLAGGEVIVEVGTFKVKTK